MCQYIIHNKMKIIYKKIRKQRYIMICIHLYFIYYIFAGPIRMLLQDY